MIKKVCAVVFLALIVTLGIGTSVRVVVKALPEYLTWEGSRLSTLKTFVCDTDSNLQKQMLFHGNWIDLFGGVMRLTGADTVADVEPQNQVYKMRNGSVTFILGRKRPFDDGQLSAIRNLKSAADAAGAESWFVCIPQKICTREKALGLSARGAVDYAEQIDAYRMRTFEAAGYSVLDLHSAMHEKQSLHEQFFFKTDHHWTPEAGIWAAKKTAEALHIPVRKLDSMHFKPLVFFNMFLGSEGKRCGRLYCACEDMSVPIPQTDMQFTVCSTDDPDKTGSFEDVMLFFKAYPKNEDVYDINPYGLILHGDHAYVSIRNLQNPDGKRVLPIKDSFSNVIAPYLALVCGQVDLIDIREFEGSAADWVRENKPDVVMVTMTARMSNDLFSFSGQGSDS